MDICIRKGNMADIENFIRLIYDVRDSMSNKEWFYVDPADKIREWMANGTMRLWVAMDGNRLAGAFDILIPGLGEDNYGHDLGFSEEELMRVINMDTAAVHPDYRGQGLQKKMMQEAEKEIRGAGKRILLCTVHPENRFSLKNVLDQGYIIQKKLEKYGSVRYILRKDIPEKQIKKKKKSMLTNPP